MEFTVHLDSYFGIDAADEEATRTALSCNKGDTILVFDLCYRYDYFVERPGSLQPYDSTIVTRFRKWRLVANGR